ncbi:TlpA family protein disulfide reductase [Nocardioides sp. GCM10027113]|uniref:TlpA family protein disulfide reductase n=1 Tax=unclassified Nocardioides TaxID=2615069 RepID=UPI00360AD6B5
MEAAGDKGYISGDGTVRELPVADREEPVELEGETLDGDRLSLESLRGTPVVAVVWGSWCAPCRAEAPDVVEAAEQLEGTAEFVGLNIRDGSPEQAKAFVRSYEVPYPSYYSPDGEAMLAFAGTLTPNSIPSFVVLDEEGRVAASIIGKLPSTTTLVTLVEDVAKSGTGKLNDGTDGAVGEPADG